MTNEDLTIRLSASFDWADLATRPEEVVKARLMVAQHILATRKALQGKQKEADDWMHEQEQAYRQRSNEITLAHQDLWKRCPHWVLDDEGICELCGVWIG